MMEGERVVPVLTKLFILIPSVFKGGYKVVDAAVEATEEKTALCLAEHEQVAVS